MIEYLAQLVICVQDYDDKNIRSSYKDMIYTFKLLNSSNFKIINNNDLISKLCERLDDIIFGSYHFSEFKNFGVDHTIYNTFEFSKTLSRRLKKSIKRKTKPAILKEEINEIKLEEIILAERCSGSIFNSDMVHTLIPEAGSGILYKLRRDELKQTDNDGKSSKKIEQVVDKLPAVVNHEDNLKNINNQFESSRMYSSDNRKSSGVNIAQNNTVQNAQLSDLTQLENQKYMLSKRKRQQIRDNSKKVTSFKAKKERDHSKLGPSANYIQTLYNPKANDTSLNHSLNNISQPKEPVNKSKLSSKNTMGSFKNKNPSPHLSFYKDDIKKLNLTELKEIIDNQITNNAELWMTSDPRTCGLKNDKNKQLKL